MTNVVKTINISESLLDTSQNNEFTAIAINGAGSSPLSNALNFASTTAKPSLPSKATAVFEYDQSGNATKITVAIVESASAPTVTNYLYKFNSLSTYRTLASNGVINLPDSDPTDVVGSRLFIAAMNSVGTTEYGSVRVPLPLVLTSVTTTESSAIITYAGQTDSLRTNVAYRADTTLNGSVTTVGTWKVCDPSPFTVTANLNNLDSKRFTIAAVNDTSDFFKIYSYQPLKDVHDCIITGKLNAPEISNLTVANGYVSFDVTLNYDDTTTEVVKSFDIYVNDALHKNDTA